MRIYAFMTGERVSEESAANGDFAEAGWVDEVFSMRVFHESRNDVRPVATYYLPTFVDSTEIETPERWALDVVKDRFGRAYDFDGAGTVYSDGAVDTDIATGDSFTYAIHFVVKAHTSEYVPDDLLPFGFNVERY